MRKTNTAELVLTALFTAIIVIMVLTPLGYIPLGIINATIIQIPVILGALFCGPKKGAFLGFVFGLTSFLKNTIAPATASAFVFSPVIAYTNIGVSGIFKSTFICFVPRILVGVVPYFVFIGIRKLIQTKNNKVWATVLNLLAGVFTYFGVNAFCARKDNVSGVAGIVVAAILAVVVAAVLEIVFLMVSSSAVSYVYAAVAGSMTNTILVMFGIYFLYKDSYAEALSIAGTAVLSVITGVISFNGVIEALTAAVIVTALGLVLVHYRPIWQNKKEQKEA